MRRVSSLGQYVPSDSWVHRLDAVAKVTVTAALTVSVFMADGFAGLLTLAVLVGAVLLGSSVPLRTASRGLRSVGILLAFTFLAHTLTFDPAEAWASLGPVGLSAEGARTGLYFAARIVVLVVGTSLLTLTTSPVDLAEGLERMMAPLKSVRVPVHDIAMMLSIALRFIPATAEEAERIISAQTARGARFGSGGPLRRARAYIPVLVPLFVGLFRRADRLATAMEARCYRGGEGRTRLQEARMAMSDWAAAATGVTALACVAVFL